MRLQKDPNYKDRYRFLCPGCEKQHSIPVASLNPEQGWVWDFSLDLPTFTPSIFVNPGRANPGREQCHSYVRSGKIQFLSDCSHKLAGKTVDLPEIPESWNL